MSRHNYPTSDYGPTRKIVNAYCEMVEERINRGYEPYLLTIMFKEIRGPKHCVISRMLENTHEAYRRCLTRVVRNAMSPSQANNLPIWICSPDLPVPKKAKKRLQDVALNDGFHVGGLALIPPIHRKKWEMRWMAIL